MPPYFKGSTTSRYRRTYTWNERNQLISSVDANYSTAYVYGQDGQRSNKFTENSETLYFNKMWTHHTDSGNSIYGGQTSKNIYLGETRVVTKLNAGKDATYQEEYYKQYYYHSDHLGSASMISDYKGDEYQRIEYTPYGETWVEKTSNTGLEYLPYKFTAKELDEETGLYYYGARYLDPKYSMWISTDPALGEYIPKAPVNEEAKRYNQNLPGMGGVFNTVNLSLYHYAANNPVKYVDPDGRKTQRSIRRNSNNKYRVGSNKEDWKSDKFGREILLHYLFGNGKELVCDSKAWADYMKANKSLTEQIEVAISKNYDNLGIEPGSKIDFDIQINAEIENGESITGYNYLHGTNETVGGLQLKGSILRNKDGTITVSYDGQWNDIMDPNPKYKTDIAKAKFAKIISFGRCKDYDIRVKWDNVYIANFQKGVENE